MLAALVRSLDLGVRLLLPGCVLLLLLPPAIAAQESGSAPAVILAAARDPYYPLAVEIAEHELTERGAPLPLLTSLDDALAQDPTFLIWVVSPPQLSDRLLVDFASAVRESPSAISLGIISGATIEEARELWRRGPQVDGRRVVAVNAARPSTSTAATIETFADERVTSSPLTRAGFRQSLEDADYLTFSGHGGRGYLRLDRETRFRSADIPPLPPLVIGTASCNTFRIWEEDCIVLGFAGRGAAAYAGFAYSPNSGYLIGGFRGVPFRYTWPGFPIGHIVQIQNRGTLRGFAHFPYYHLLGDPRIALQARAPYSLVDDREDGETRTLNFTGAPAGFIPVHVPDGARFSFVEIPGVAAASERDPFYNSRLEMANIQGDKYLLFAHSGGDFSLQLRRRAPGHWRVTDLITDALDDALIHRPQCGSTNAILILLDGLAVGVVAWLLRRRRARARCLPLCLLVGLVFAALHAAYMLARVEQVTITSRPVTVSLLAPLSTLLLVGCGAFLFLEARSLRARVAGLLVAVSFPLLAAAFSLGAIALLNTFITRPKLGTPVWNHNPGLMPLVALVIEGTLVALALVVMRGRWRRGDPRAQQL